MIKEFVKDVKSGKKIDFNRIYKPLVNFIYRSCNIVKKRHGINLNQDEIKDIIQETFIKLVNSDYSIVKKINDIEKSEGYIFRMVRNEIFSLCKNKGRIKSNDILLKKGTKEYNQKTNRFIFKGDHTDYLVSEEYLVLMKTFFDNIKNVKHKEIFIKKLNNFKSSDISKQTGLSETNINTIFSRLKDDFVRLLKENNLYDMNDEILKAIINWFKDEYEEKDNKEDSDNEA